MMGKTGKTKIMLAALLVLSLLLCCAAALAEHDYQLTYNAGRVTWVPAADESIENNSYDSLRLKGGSLSGDAIMYIYASNTALNDGTYTTDFYNSVGYRFIKHKPGNYTLSLYTGEAYDNTLKALTSIQFSITALEVGNANVVISENNKNQTLGELAGLTGTFASRVNDETGAFCCQFRGADSNIYPLDTVVDSLPRGMTLTLEAYLPSDLDGDPYQSALKDNIGSNNSMTVTFANAPTNMHVEAYQITGGTASATIAWDGEENAYEVSADGDIWTDVAGKEYTFTNPPQADEYTFLIRVDGETRSYSFSYTPMTASVTGAAFPGLKLSVNVSNAFGNHAIAWYVDGVEQDGATESTFTVPDDAMDKQIYAVVTDEVTSVTTSALTVEAIPAVTLAWTNPGAYDKITITGLSALPTLGNGNNYALWMDWGNGQSGMAGTGWFDGGSGQENVKIVDSMTYQMYKGVSGEVSFYLKGYLDSDGTFIDIPCNRLTMTITPLDLAPTDLKINSQWNSVGIQRFIGFTGTLADDLQWRWERPGDTAARVWLGAYDADGTKIGSYEVDYHSTVTSIFSDERIAYLMLESAVVTDSGKQYAAAVNANVKISVIHEALPELTGLAFDDLTLSWDAVPGAQSYKVTLEDTLENRYVSEPRADDVARLFNFTEDKSMQDFSVMALDQDGFPASQKATARGGTYWTLSFGVSYLDLRLYSKFEPTPLLDLLKIQGSHKADIESGKATLTLQMGTAGMTVPASYTVGQFIEQCWATYHDESARLQMHQIAWGRTTGGPSRQAAA